MNFVEVVRKLRIAPPNDHVPGLRFIVLRIFLPFAAGYFLSYLYRTVNAVLGPILETAFMVSSFSVGLLTGVFFITFASVQIPLGMSLDRFGPRRTQIMLLGVAAIASFLFAFGNDFTVLTFARALLGVGTAGCLLASFKLFALWVPRQKLPLVNGLLLAFGGAGAMAAASPAHLVIDAFGWQTLFVITGVMTLLVVLTIGLVVPERTATDAALAPRGQWRGIRQILGSRLFWSVAPLVMTAQAAWMSTQALWFGPWLRDIGGLQANEAANALFIGGFGMLLGYASLGWLAERLSRIGVPVGFVAGIATGLFIVVQILLATGSTLPAWFLTAAFAYTGGAPTIFYAALTQKFPVAMAGRVNTSLAMFTFMLAGILQFSVGFVLDLFRSTNGSVAEEGYLIAFGGWALVQIVCFAWFLFRQRS